MGRGRLEHYCVSTRHSSKALTELNGFQSLSLLVEDFQSHSSLMYEKEEEACAESKRSPTILSVLPHLVPAARSLSHEVVAQGSSATLLRCGDDG